MGINATHVINECGIALKSVSSIAYMLHRVDITEAEKETMLQKLCDAHDTLAEIQNSFFKPNHRVSYNKVCFLHQHKNSHMKSVE